MSESPPGAVMMELVTRMLKEAFEGAPGPWTYFTDTSRGTGIFATINGLTATEASQVGGPSGSTIAAHVQHLIASTRATALSLRGQHVSLERGHGWTPTIVDERVWSALRDALRSEYNALLVSVGMRTKWNEEMVGTAYGAVAHSAYHLGAIRQRIPPGKA